LSEEESNEVPVQVKSEEESDEKIADLLIQKEPQGPELSVEELKDLLSQEKEKTTQLHTTAHLMLAGLRKVLGDHVQQKGSLVAPDRLRFDFSHYDGVTDEQLADIEDMVNEEIRRNVAAETKLMSYDAAVESGRMTAFAKPLPCSRSSSCCALVRSPRRARRWRNTAQPRACLPAARTC